ncbi:MAG: ATP-binding protein [Anaerolinea sp.]|nr:ATP-binding protein [Anaerolinea sp.]
MAPSNPGYYLGKIFDIKTNAPTSEQVLLDPSNLTTHAVVTGMTGSGKTGLCIGLLEEAALHGIPAIIIDPKGDLTNLLLHFPSLLPTDFEPWIDPEIARQSGKTVEQSSTETAEKWKKGLEGSGLGPEQLKALGDTADYTIFTPGSSSGVSVNILSSFQSPDLDWESNSEMLRERISSTVTALLGLIGLSDIDPLRSREHILLSNLIETAWVNKQSLTLTDLILQVQTPPMERLGAFPMESFFPEKERFSLAILLNNFLAAPSFQVWQQGQTLDIAELLYPKSGKPRHSIFYLAHLSENERMFFVTLLFAAVESWMRSQRGTGNLRALVYFDEIMGYLPPVANPASKTVMMRMLKQARAFGVGLVLATQNPVDVDYKALSNAGTWMIGRLQTDQDKQRLLDGLTSAGGSTNVATFDKLISGLQKRVFLYHSIYKPAPVTFSTRWTLNFLAGPMTRDQIPQANKLVGIENGKKFVASASSSTDAAPTKPTAASKSAEMTSSRPAIPGNINEYFLPATKGFSEAASAANLPTGLSAKGLVYKAALLMQAEVRYLSRQYALETSKKIAAVLETPGTGLVKWENNTIGALDLQKLESQSMPNSQFHPVAAWLGDAKKTVDLQKDFLEWIYRTGSIKLKSNTALKIYATPEMTQADFHTRCTAAAREMTAAEMEKVSSTLDTKISTLQRKIDAQELDVKAAQNAVNQRNLESLATGGSALFGMLTGRKRSLSSTMSKVRMSEAAKDKKLAEEQDLDALNDQMKELLLQKERTLKDVTEKWANVTAKITEVSITPTKSDIFSELFGVGWLPYYLTENAGSPVEIPAF